MKKSRIKEAEDRFEELMHKPTHEMTDYEVDLMLDYAKLAITKTRRQRRLKIFGENMKILGIIAAASLLIRFILRITTV